ncbi:hypothetical protein INR49_005523 [Caranx melampygus]|nr:hypothetical protein INR49_005523 [Caranx melampygus]
MFNRRWRSQALPHLGTVSPATSPGCLPHPPTSVALEHHGPASPPTVPWAIAEGRRQSGDVQKEASSRRERK